MVAMPFTKQKEGSSVKRANRLEISLKTSRAAEAKKHTQPSANVLTAITQNRVAPSRFALHVGESHGFAVSAS